MEDTLTVVLYFLEEILFQVFHFVRLLHPLHRLQVVHSDKVLAFLQDLESMVINSRHMVLLLFQDSNLRMLLLLFEASNLRMLLYFLQLNSLHILRYFLLHFLLVNSFLLIIRIILVAVLMGDLDLVVHLVIGLNLVVIKAVRHRIVMTIAKIDVHLLETMAVILTVFHLTPISHRYHHGVAHL